MPILVTCACGKAFKAPDKLSGKVVKCPGCQKGVKVVASKNSPVAPEVIQVSCDSCNKAFQVPKKYQGKRVKCPGCQLPVLVESTKRESVQTPKPSKAAAAQKNPKVAPRPTGGGGDRCPQCEKPMTSGDVVCTSCGHNIKTGQSIGRVTTDEDNVSETELNMFIGIGVCLVGGIGFLIYYFIF